MKIAPRGVIASGILLTSLGLMAIPFGSLRAASDPMTSATQSSVSLSAGTIDLRDAVTVTVVARNAAGEPLENRLIQILSTIPFSSVPQAAYTDAQGQGSYQMHFGRTGNAALTVKFGTVVLANSPTVHVIDTSVSGAQTSVTVTPTQAVADGQQKITVSVVVRDGSGQAVVGKKVSLMTSQTGTVVIAPVETTTDAAGLATFELRSAKAVSAGVAAYVDGDVMNQQPRVFFTAPAACPFASWSLIKLPDDGSPVTQEDSAVYFYGGDCRRHPFPNEKVFFTWYQGFTGVAILSTSEMASIPLGANATYRPGVLLVKFPSIPKVYAVARGGVLRWIASEDVAVGLYGVAWNRKVHDIPESFYSNYTFGPDILSASVFIPENETANTPSINDDI